MTGRAPTGSQHSSRLLGESDSGHSAIGFPLQSSGGDGQPALFDLDGGFARLPVDNPDEADAPVVSGIACVQRHGECVVYACTCTYVHANNVTLSM